MRFTSFALAAFSMGSALAAPAVHQPHARAVEILSTATTTVSTVKTTVEGELQSVSKLVVSIGGAANSTALVPQLEQSLLSIAGEVTKIVGSVLPIITEGVPTLAEDELNNLPDLLNNVLSIANGLQSTATQIVNGVGADVLKAIKPELQLALSTVEPIAKPIISLALGAVGDITSPLVTEVNGLVGDIENVTGSILSPVTDLVSKIL
ncbi:hypothetical protein GGR53DRAFT_279144 [Hypoxylon sp. FL1150]|nr:hypothetical protein GGR53DRAFT_279144 [Hypoxylon sp. FL1150]